MRSSFHSVQKQHGPSSYLDSGERGAVAPVSALKLFRAGIKRRRGEGGTYDALEERKIDTNGNGNDIDNGEKKDFPLSLPLSSPVCLVSNPLFSLPLGITELSGPAGVGKTQIALSLCADCVQQQQHNGQQQGKYQNKNKAVFIQLGGSSRFLQIASRRIEQMLWSRISANTAARNHTTTSTRHQQGRAQHQHSDVETVHDCLTRILVHWVCNSEELMELLQTSLPRLLRMHPTISIVVLDGIANLFRLLSQQEQQRLFCADGKNNDRASSSNPWHERAATFFQISNRCKELSSRFEIPFVILNECTSRIPPAVKHQQQPKAILEPALGLAWSQCVNCSYFVRRVSTRTSNATTVQQQSDRTIEQSRRSGTCNTLHKQQGVCHRILQCLKAPHVPAEHSIAKFWIDRSGIILIRNPFS